MISIIVLKYVLKFIISVWLHWIFNIAWTIHEKTSPNQVNRGKPFPIYSHQNDFIAHSKRLTWLAPRYRLLSSWMTQSTEHTLKFLVSLLAMWYCAFSMDERINPLHSTVFCRNTRKERSNLKRICSSKWKSKQACTKKHDQIENIVDRFYTRRHIWCDGGGHPTQHRIYPSLVHFCL